MKRDDVGLPVELPSWPESGVDFCSCHFEERLVLGESDAYLEAAIAKRLAKLELAALDELVEREGSEA